MTETLVQKQNRLALAAKAGDKRALAELFESMQGYIVIVRNRYAQHQLENEDIEQACRVGILRGLRDFDPAKGSIGAVSSHWMREEIRLLADMMLRPVRLPQSRPMKRIQWQVLPRMRKLKAAGMNEDEAMTLAAEEAGIDVNDVRRFFASTGTVQIGVRHEDGIGGEMFEPSETPDPLAGAAHQDREEALRIVRFAVSEKDWDVLTGRLFHDETFEAIGARYGVSKERARHLLRDAIARAALALEEEGLGPEALL